MSIGTKIVQRSLQEIGAHSAVQPASNESLDSGFEKLTSMVAKWEDDGIRMGTVPLEVIGDELSEPKSCTNGIVYNLALMLAPDHPGSQVSPQLRANAIKEMAFIKRRFKPITIPGQKLRETYPVGQGRQRDSFNGGYWSESFHEEGDEIG